MQRDGCVLAADQPPPPHQVLRLQRLRLLPPRQQLQLQLQLQRLLLLPPRQQRQLAQPRQLLQAQPRLLPRPQDRSRISLIFPRECASRLVTTCSSLVSSSRAAQISALSFVASALRSLTSE